MRYLEQSNVERPKVAHWLPVAGRLKKWDLLFNGYKVSVRDAEKFLEMGGGDGCTTMWMYLRSQITLKSGRLCVKHIFTTMKKKQ